ncbi:phosphate ABC transporter substrate-binding protein [Ketobacter sp.]
MKFIHLALLSVLFFSSIAHAEIAVIVHPSAGFNDLNEDDIKRIFLGKSKKFPNGASTNPVNQSEGNNIRDQFIDKVLQKSPGQYRAYWSQLIFTGKGSPPKDSGNSAEIKAMVADNKDMIGYIDLVSVDDTVKVVFVAK